LKRFIYDQVIDRENICNMEQETKIILGKFADRRNLVIYAPRNYGKTSLVKNIIIPEFKARNKGAFVYFVDLQDVKDLQHLNEIIQKAFEQAFAESFPAGSLVNKIKEYLYSFQPELSIDSLTAKMTFALNSNKSKFRQIDISEIFSLINQINKKHPTLIVFDEFQVIAKFEKLDATFRSLFQVLDSVPIIIMGSQKHLLLELFANSNAPLANFGTDVEIHEIPYEIYHSYIQERFAIYDLAISSETTKHIQDSMNRIPEFINIVADNLLILAKELKLKSVENVSLVDQVISLLVDNKLSRFNAVLTPLSMSEENVLIAIAKANRVSKPNSKEFLQSVTVSQSAVQKIIYKLLMNGYLEYNQQEYYVSDPLLNLYLAKYR